MKNRILKLLVFGVIIIFNQSCSDDELPYTIDINTPDEVKSIESFVQGKIGEVNLDTFFINCENSVKLTTNSVTHTDNFFIIRQGIKLEINENLTIWGNVYIYDEIKKPDFLTTNLLKTYIDFSPEKVIFDLEVRSNSEIYRNHSLESLSLSEGFDDRIDVIADNQVLLFESKPPFTMNCYGELDILPLIISYSGKLKTTDELQSITIDNFEMKINLRSL